MSQNDHTTNDIVSTTETQQSFPFQRLAAELRSNVLGQIPNSDLWRCCQTSCSLRSEAARQLLLQSGLDIIISPIRITSSLSLDMIDARSKIPLTVTVHVKCRPDCEHLCCLDAKTRVRIEVLRQQLAHKGLSKANIGVFNIVYEDTRRYLAPDCGLPDLFKDSSTQISHPCYTLRMTSEGVSTKDDPERTREEREGISEYLVSVQLSSNDTIVYQGMTDTANKSSQIGISNNIGLTKCGMQNSAGILMKYRGASCNIIGMTKNEADEQDWREGIAGYLITRRPFREDPISSREYADRCVNELARFMSTEEFEASEAAKLLTRYREKRRQDQAEVYLIANADDSESGV